MKNKRDRSAALRSSTTCIGGPKCPPGDGISRRSQASDLIELQQHLAKAATEAGLAVDFAWKIKLNFVQRTELENAYGTLDVYSQRVKAALSKGLKSANK